MQNQAPPPSTAEVYGCDFSLLMLSDLMLGLWAGDGFSTMPARDGWEDSFGGFFSSAQGAHGGGCLLHTNIKILGPRSQNHDPLGHWLLAQVYHTVTDSLYIPVIC